MVLKAEGQNPKFCFLKIGDTYRAYYDSKILEYTRGAPKEEKKEEPA